MPSAPLKGLAAWAVQEALLGPPLGSGVASEFRHWALVLAQWGQPCLCLAMDPPDPPDPPDVGQHPSLALALPQFRGPSQPSRAVSDPGDHPWTHWVLQGCARRVRAPRASPHQPPSPASHLPSLHGAAPAPASLWPLHRIA